jgi:hypothetical protein
MLCITCLQSHVNSAEVSEQMKELLSPLLDPNEVEEQQASHTQEKTRLSWTRSAARAVRYSSSMLGGIGVGVSKQLNMHAPAQSLLALSISGAANPVAFTAWFYFRRRYLLLCSAALCISLLCAVFVSQSINEVLLSGASLSLVFGVLVLWSYVRIVPWRKHPSPLIFYRTISVCIFSCVVICNSALHRDKVNLTVHPFRFVCTHTRRTSKASINQWEDRVVYYSPGLHSSR